AQEGTHLVATLTGTTGSGTAHYHVDVTATNNALKVKVTGLTANTTYDVLLDDVNVGSLTTDANGAGTVTLTNLTNTVTAGTSTLSLTVTTTDPTTGATTTATVLSGTFATAPAHHHGHRRGR